MSGLTPLYSDLRINCLALIEARSGYEENRAFIQEFVNWESAWASEAFYVVVFEMRILAERVMTAYLYRRGAQMEGQGYHMYDPFCWQAFGELYTPTVPQIGCLQQGTPSSSWDPVETGCPA
ncbi:hypothetical protein Tco_0930481 [Tanacetum coccineum]